MSESGEHEDHRRRGLFRRAAEHRELDAELSADFGIDFSEHLEGLRDALAACIDAARHAGLDTPVPTCPEWRCVASARSRAGSRAIPGHRSSG